MVKPEQVGMQSPWGAPGRGGHFGPSGTSTVVDGLVQVSSDVEALKKQMAQMGVALRTVGLADPMVEAAAVGAGGAEVRCGRDGMRRDGTGASEAGHRDQ
mgnify:CR=1 FL=1